MNQAAVLFGYEQIGGSQAALDMAINYSKERYAFGRQIGSFQAIKITNVKNIVYGGGVSANSMIRERFKSNMKNINHYFPKLEYTTDNAAMIAIVGYLKYKTKNFGMLNAVSDAKYKM